MPDPNTPPADGTQGNEGGTTPPPAAGGTTPPTTPERTFTQAELDSILKERLARAVPADYAELQRKAAAHDAQEEASKTELQKAQDAEAKAKADAKSERERANGILIRASIIEQASAQKAADSETVIALLMGDTSIQIASDGVTVTGVKEAVAKLLKAKPFLVAGGTTPSTSGGEFGGNDGKTLAAKIKEAEAKGDWREARRLKLQQLNVGASAPQGATT